MSALYTILSIHCTIAKDSGSGGWINGELSYVRTECVLSAVRRRIIRVPNVLVICKSTLHATAMHLYKRESRQGSSQETNVVHGGERPDVATMCTTLCRLRSSGRSSAKIVMARVFPNDRLESAVTVSAILDEQSTHTLARPRTFR